MKQANNEYRKNKFVKTGSILIRIHNNIITIAFFFYGSDRFSKIVFVKLGTSSNRDKSTISRRRKLFIIDPLNGKKIINVYPLKKKIFSYFCFDF